MPSRKIVSLILAGLCLATTVGLGMNTRGEAETLRQRLKDRRDGDSNQQQSNNPNPSPAGYPAAGGTPEVSEVTLQTQPGPNGQQMVVTPKGMVVPLPGPGVNSPTVSIYIGSNGGYWYVDRNGQQVDLTEAVQYYQQKMAQQAAANMAPVPQYAPPPEQQSTSNNGSNAAATAAVAGLGAMAGSMAGSAIAGSNNYWPVPYGTPIHYGAGAVPYYNQGGKPVYVNNSSHNNVQVNQANLNQANINKANAYHATNVQQQQQWYQKQQTEKTSNWKNWQKNSSAANPFVRPEYQQTSANRAAAGRNAEGERSGRFGRGESGNADGGRFGRGEGRSGGREARGGRRRR